MSPSYCTTNNRSRSRGFTLIEILIVVIILGILAAIVMPQFSNATSVARESTLREDLRYLRTQIATFKYQHRDVTPGHLDGDVANAPDAATFLNQMIKFSDERCSLSDTPSASHRYGPYLTKMPPNPLTGKSGILVVMGNSMPPADNTQSHGWIYNAELEKIQANMEGNDSTGKPYASY